MSLTLKAGDARQCSSSSHVKYAECEYTVSFNSGHTCPKIQELKHYKVNSLSSSVHESPCCFPFISEKNVGVNCILSWAYMMGEKNLCASFKSKGKPSCSRSHTVGRAGGRQICASEGR